MASIKQRGDSYLITVSMGYDVNGKKLFQTTTYKPEPGLTKKQIEKAVYTFATLFENQCKNGETLDGRKITLKEFIDRWIKDYATSNLQPGTLEDYQDLISRFILPSLGHKKMTEIKPHTIASFANELSQDGAKQNGKSGGYSKASIRKITAVLSSILRTATEWEVIPSNPCDKVRSKGDDMADKIKFFTPQQTASFLDFIEKPYTIQTSGHTRTDDTGVQYEVGIYDSRREMSEQMRCLFNLAVLSGLRKGELLALQWADIDFDNNVILVAKSTAIVNGKQIVKAPKTKTSTRKVSIPQSMTERLKKLKTDQTRHKLQMGASWQDGDWVFTQADGNQMSYYTPLKALHDAIRHYNNSHPDSEQLPMIPFHGLRHTSATLLIASNMDMKTVSGRLGHAQTSTTVNIYAHRLLKADEEAASVIEDVIKKA